MLVTYIQKKISVTMQFLTERRVKVLMPASCESQHIWIYEHKFLIGTEGRQAASSARGLQLGTSGEVILNWQRNLDPVDILIFLAVRRVPPRFLFIFLIAE